METIIKQQEKLNKKASTEFINAIKENRYDSVSWDNYSMFFDFGEKIRMSLWIANEDYGLSIKYPYHISFTKEQKKELFELVRIVKITNKQIEFNQYSNDLFWKYNCICGEKLGCTGYNDDNWWNNVAPNHEIEKCKCGLSWKVNLKTNTASILYKDFIAIKDKKQIEIEAKKKEEYEKAKKIVDDYLKQTS